MGSQLSKTEKKKLLFLHRSSKDKRECDRIKAILAYDDGYSYSEIARILLIDDETVRRHIDDYILQKKTKTANGGSDRLLNELEQMELSCHLEEVTYLDVKSICAYVKSTYQVAYSPSGMRQLLHALNFCYKKPHPVPAKADKVAQEAYFTLKVEKRHLDSMLDHIRNMKKSAIFLLFICFYYKK